MVVGTRIKQDCATTHSSLAHLCIYVSKEACGIVARGSQWEIHMYDMYVYMYIILVHSYVQMYIHMYLRNTTYVRTYIHKSTEQNLLL